MALDGETEGENETVKYARNKKCNSSRNVKKQLESFLLWVLYSDFKGSKILAPRNEIPGRN